MIPFRSNAEINDSLSTPCDRHAISFAKAAAAEALEFFFANAQETTIARLMNSERVREKRSLFINCYADLKKKSGYLNSVFRQRMFPTTKTYRALIKLH